MKVYRFSQLPDCTFQYKIGYLNAISRLMSSSSTSENTGSSVNKVEQPNISIPLKIGMATKQNTAQKIACITLMIMPLWMMNWERTQLRLQQFRPCHKRSVVRQENYVIEKSEASAACIPSLPQIPIPTSADWIIPTSLPPSPIPKILFSVYLRSVQVTQAFWVGEQREHTRLGTLEASLKNGSLNSLKASLREVPSIIIRMFWKVQFGWDLR